MAIDISDGRSDGRLPNPDRLSLLYANYSSNQLAAPHAGPLAIFATSDPGRGIRRSPPSPPNSPELIGEPRHLWRASAFDRPRKRFRRVSTQLSEDQLLSLLGDGRVSKRRAR